MTKQPAISTEPSAASGEPEPSEPAARASAPSAGEARSPGPIRITKEQMRANKGKRRPISREELEASKEQGDPYRLKELGYAVRPIDQWEDPDDPERPVVYRWTGRRLVRT